MNSEGNDQNPTPLRFLTMLRSHHPRIEEEEHREDDPLSTDDKHEKTQPLAGEDEMRTREEFDKTVEKDLNSDPAKKTVWHVYNDKSSKADESFLKAINDSMDVLLVFAGLFSATAAAFLSFTLPLLDDDSSQTTNQLLLSIFYKLDNATYQLPVQSSFTPSANAIVVNALIFISVAGSLLAAFFAILTKQWLGSIQEGLSTIENQSSRASIRQYRMEGVRDWYFEELAAMLPVLLHFSLALFGAGVVDFLYIKEELVLAWVLLTTLIVGTLLYVFLSITPLKFPKAPFWPPLTALLHYIRGLLIKILQLIQPLCNKHLPKLSRK